MDPVIYALLWGFILGSIYLGLAIGFSIVVGVLRIFHMGYGMFMVLPIYLTWIFWNNLKFSLFFSVLFSIIFTSFISIIMYYFIKKFIDHQEYMLTSLILIFLIVQEIINIMYPPTEAIYLPLRILNGWINIAGVEISQQYILITCISIIIFFIYVLFLKYTRFGLVMRAITQDFVTARMMGIQVSRVFSLSLGLAVVPTSITMILYSPIIGIYPYLGLSYFVYALQVAILGGLGNLKGTFMSAYIVGYTHAVVGFLVNPRAMNLASLIVTLLILLFKPKGLARAESIW